MRPCAPHSGIYCGHTKSKNMHSSEILHQGTRAAFGERGISREGIFWRLLDVNL